MKRILKFLFLSLIVIALSNTSAVAQDVLDGVYKKVTTTEKEIIPYDHIRESDVFWSKRIWRSIDVREKMNLPFKYPRQPFGEIVHTACMNGELTSYRNIPGANGDFTEVLPVDEVRTLGYSKDTSWQINPETLEEEQVVIENELTYDKIVKFKVKEDWFFDEETSTFQVRIIGVAPVMEAYDASGNYIGDETMYWVYYPDLRPIMVKYEVYNNKNDAIRMSWDDVFEMRWFSSYIYMESNVYDRIIGEYSSGVDALLESDRIKREMFEFEHDLWTF